MMLMREGTFFNVRHVKKRDRVFSIFTSQKSIKNPYEAVRSNLVAKQLLTKHFVDGVTSF